MYVYVYVHEGLKIIKILGDLGEKTDFQAQIRIKFHTSQG